MTNLNEPKTTEEIKSIEEPVTVEKSPKARIGKLGIAAIVFFSIAALLMDIMYVVDFLSYSYFTLYSRPFAPFLSYHRAIEYWFVFATCIFSIVALCKKNKTLYRISLGLCTIVGCRWLASIDGNLFLYALDFMYVPFFALGVLFLLMATVFLLISYGCPDKKAALSISFYGFAKIPQCIVAGIVVDVLCMALEPLLSQWFHQFALLRYSANIWTSYDRFLYYLPFFIAFFLLLLYGYRQEEKPKGKRKKGYVGMAKHAICMALIPFVWNIVFTYRTTKYLNRAEGKQCGPVRKTLLCLFVPFYSIYWYHRHSKKAASLSGTTNRVAACTVWSIFLPIVASALLQDQINQLIEREE